MIEPDPNVSFDSSRFPKAIELHLDDELSQWLHQASAVSGRCETELLLELLDRGLQTF